MIDVITYTATIYCGLKEGYNGLQHSIGEVYPILREYVDRVGLGVSVEETNFIYTGGGEKGVKITIINYPRFPSSPHEIVEHAKNIGMLLKEKFKQERLSIVATDKTIMIGEK